MRTSQILLVAAVATVQAASLTERDTVECLSVASSLIPALTDVPTPDSKLLSFIATQTQVTAVTGACQVPAITGSMAAEYSSYISSATSWASAHKKDISSLLSACSDVPQFSSALAQYPEVTSLCESYTWVSAGATGGATGATAAASGATATGTAAAATGNAAPQQTGVMLAAAGVAGLAIAGLY